jgi:hypothetical protein
MALAMCALFPRAGHAELSHDALWGPVDAGACANPDANFSESDSLVTSRKSEAKNSEEGTARSREATDCLADDSRDAYNVCFEEAGVPASVVPKLSAKVRAFQQSDELIEQATALVGLETTEESDERVASRLHPLEVAPPAEQPNPNKSCTVDRQERCRSLPPLPPSLNLEASGAAPYMPVGNLDLPADPDPTDETTIPERHNILPADGYRSPPLKPPRG